VNSHDIFFLKDKKGNLEMLKETKSEDFQEI
jgi:hypothetical protein